MARAFEAGAGMRIKRAQRHQNPVAKFAFTARPKQGRT
ncbi:hypothetical protein PANN_61550 [Pseudomonas aeruginosa C-NN2]|nr:hypothetical protein PANN_61550 [Pseudomonas aeruginosa C-NN2]